MSHDALLFASVFLACAVEGVEAVTIVLAAGITRGWRSAWAGVAAALAALAAFVALMGPALTALPLSALRLVVGGLLLVFGLQWLRKAILRASGFKALHDEDAIYAEEVAELGGLPVAAQGLDAFGFTVSFKGVLLEGLEVAFIVVTFGSNQQNVPLAVVAALAAVAAVVTAGVIAHRPLSRVPENTLKYAVGVMLTSFGMFWGAEGAGASWPGGDGAIPVLVAFTLLVSLALVATLRRRHSRIGAVGGSEVQA
ncbi:MAG TPA: hypothetical protein VMT10_12900 [Solirubrobacteraceae bacterium]|nr:hypothetical protein [Solirubrobacteraceae bacterium]